MRVPKSLESVVRASSDGGDPVDEVYGDAVCSSEAAGAGGGAGDRGFLRMGRGIGGGSWSGMVLSYVLMLISLDVSRIRTFDARRPIKTDNGAIEPLPKRYMVAY